MTRFALISLTGLFLITALAVSLVGGAQATNPISHADAQASTEPATQAHCALAPMLIANPMFGSQVQTMSRAC